MSSVESSGRVPADAARRARTLASSQLWLLNVVLLALLCGQYLGAARPDTVRGWIFLQSCRLSCAASLSLIPGLLCLLLARWLRARLWLALLSGFVWSLALLLVYVDTRIYELFRYHFNGLVWNVLTTPGGDEAFQLSGSELALGLGLFGLLIPAEGAAFLAAWRWIERRHTSALPVPRLARPRFAWSLVLVPNLFLAAGMYARADLARDLHVTAFDRVYPFYPRMTIKRFADRFLGVELKERPAVDLPSEGLLLDYPKRPVTLPASGPTPNIVVVVIDSLRADMLNAEVMPRTSELARRARVFRDHLSSGNATRFGVFGIVYGLHGSYWKAVCQEHRSPVLIDALLGRGYDMRVLTSASMDYPEFRSTAWVKIEDRVEDRLPFTRPGGRDDGVAERFEQWLDEHGDAPFFAFLLLDAPHQRYWFPESCAVFEPFLDEVAYSSIDESAAEGVREGLFNRYRNAVYYADQTTGRVLDALSKKGLTENTVVVVTGDHGEEFFENGFWGHTSNFARSQTHVPLVMAGPGVPPGEELRPTCHIDLPATLLELLGADPALRADWTLGANLLDPPEQRARIVSGWDTLGMHDSNVILEVPMATHGGTEIAAYDPGWRRIYDDEDLLRTEARAIGALALQCRRFLR